MDALKLLCVFLLVIHSLDAAALRCPWTQFRLRVLNKESIELLENMGDLMPLKCLEKGERTFPKDAFSQAQKEDVAVVALETLKGVERIFKNQQTSVSWDREKLALFKNIISSRQVENLRKCVSADSLSADSSVVLLKSYFEELEQHLRLKDFGECAWERVREEIQRSLRELQAFLESRT